MTILHLLLSITETSGAYNQHCLAVSHRRDLTICTFFKSPIPVPKEITLFEGNGSLAGFFRALQTALAAGNYHIIHAHSPHVGFLLVAAKMFMPGKLRPVTVYNVQNSYQNYKLRNKLLLLPVFAFFQRIVCCSDACLESFPRFYKWLAAGRLRVVPNGLDIDRVDRVKPNQSAHSFNGHFTVASVGRLIEIKNPLSILSAFQQSHDNGHVKRLLFIGDGHLRDKITREIQTLGLANRVELTGLIPRDKVFEKLAHADVVVSASHGEGLPVAVIEAMACRCPVILSDIPPHREIARGADFIPLVQPDDVSAMAREIKRFQQMPAAQRAEIGWQCRKLVEERFSLATMHKGYEEIYKQIRLRMNSQAQK
jgi:glycosyltransferase involved in cell wall biosynthesis